MSQVFSFHDHPVRTLTENGQTWFVGRDIALLLGYAQPDKEIRRICKYVKLFKATNLVGLGNSPRGMLLIPEPDVWRLIVRSNKLEAQELEEWIMSEVLPAIRKTGKYEVKSKPKALPRSKRKALPPRDPVAEEIEELLAKVEFYTKEVDLAGEEIARIMARESLKKDPDLPEKFGDPHHDFHIHTATSVRFLFSSINFSLNAVRDAVKIRRDHGI